MEFGCPRSISQGTDFSLASLFKKPSQHLWEPTEMRHPRAARAQPSAPNWRLRGEPGECGPRKEHWTGSPQGWP